MDGQKHGKIVRGFSMVDPEMVSKLHTDIKERGKVEENEGNSYGYNFREIAHFNFTLPDFSRFDDGFVEFLMKDLVENSTLKALEESGHLNWWTKGSCLQRLLPLLTSGDGNCLLHAASLGIWGVHDRLLNLRQAIYQTLSSSLAEKTLKRRWQWYNWVKNLEEGLVLSADEWEAEWRSVLNMADAKPRSPQQPLSTVPEASVVENKEIPPGASSWQPRYESLEEIHICSLAHVLRRPIIVVSDTWFYDIQGNRMSPIPFAGVYLPVECDPGECCRVPLVLAYSSSHFSPVVSSELQNEATPTADSKTSPDLQKTNSSSGVQSAILLKPSKHPSSDKTSKASDETPMGTASSTIQAAVTSIYQKTKSTLRQAAKSLNPSNTPTTSTTNHNQSNLAAIPLVDKELKTLPLPFAVDPGQKWNLLEQDNSEDIIRGKSLTDDKRMELLKKYLDVVVINIESLDRNDEAGSSETQSESFTKYFPVPVAILPCDNQPSFYKQVITGYLERAKERFNFEKETRLNEPKQSPSVECANDSCDLYGTVANNYLCTKCFQLQTKSIIKFQGPPPPYAPPSYSEAVGNKPVFHPPSLTPTNSSNAEKTTTLAEQSVQCRGPGCTFYGTSDKMGFCSKCYDKNKK